MEDLGPQINAMDVRVDESRGTTNVLIFIHQFFVLGKDKSLPKGKEKGVDHVVCKE